MASYRRTYPAYGARVSRESSQRSCSVCKGHTREGYKQDSCSSSQWIWRTSSTSGPGGSLRDQPGFSGLYLVCFILLGIACRVEAMGSNPSPLPVMSPATSDCLEHYFSVFSYYHVCVDFSGSFDFSLIFHRLITTESFSPILYCRPDVVTLGNPF